jgi:very-short-patch-repair endonuclease
VTLDRALAARLTDVARLDRKLVRLGLRGRKGAGELARLVHERMAMKAMPQSEFELLLLRALRLHGLPLPKCQHRVRLASGRSAFLDFAYPEAMLGLEADSYRHHSSLSEWSKDRTRHNELVALGWRILPVTFDELTKRTDLVADQVARALSHGRFGT